MRAIAAALILSSLTACANSGSQSGNALMTSPISLSIDDAKQIIQGQRSRIWKDPDSIRDARIGQPYSCAGGLAQVARPPDACVCVEANAKNSFGGYTGLRRNEVLFSDRQIVDVVDARESTYSCGQMMPFPEINGGRS